MPCLAMFSAIGTGRKLQIQSSPCGSSMVFANVATKLIQIQSERRYYLNTVAALFLIAYCRKWNERGTDAAVVNDIADDETMVGEPALFFVGIMND